MSERSMNKLKLVMCMVLLLGLAFASSTSQANVTYSFDKITNNGPADLSGYFQMVVSEDSLGVVRFTFNNLGTNTDSGFIKGVYFDDGALLNSLFGIDDDPTDVDFEQILNPPDLPGGGAIVPKFETSDSYKAKADNPGTGGEGVDYGESLGILFTLYDGGDGTYDPGDPSFTDVINDLNSGVIRVGIHVGGLGDTTWDNNWSDSFVNNGIIPAPGAVLLGSIGAGLVGWLRRRRTI